MAPIAPPPDTQSRMPEIIAGKYEVLQTIGRGGMGTVYKAVQRNLDRVVAIKMLSEELASDPEFRARFQQEATVVARLSHPNIVAVHDIEPHNHTFCIIMEFLEGENLQAKIDRDVSLAERDAVLIGAQVARALGYAHSQGIIHRDIKPDNVHVTPQGVAKVMDFGIARFLDSKLKTQTGISMGTPKFMSPEQVTGKNVDGQTDLYSLGVCLYYCLAGRPPFDGENAIAVATRHLYEQPDPPSRFNTSISPAVEKVIMRALEKQKSERYTTGFDMADALEGTLGIRSPIRIADDTTAHVYSGATQRISLQAVGGGVAEIEITEPLDHTPGGSLNPAPVVHSGRTQSPRGEGWSNVTPVPMRSVSDGLDKFSAPEIAGEDTATPVHDFDPAIAMRKWWPALAAFALLGLGAAYLAFATASGTIGVVKQAPVTQPSGEQQLTVVQNQADDLVSQRRYKEARQKWLEFKASHHDVQSAAVDQKIERLTNQLPITETDALAKRRREKGLALAGVASREPLAAAYLQGAVDLDPQGSKLLAGQLKQLQSFLDKQVQVAELRAAQEAVARGKKLSSGAGSNPAQAEEAFLQAATLEPGNGSNWMALGDFYQAQQQIDDARVMYSAAAQYDKNPDIKREATTKRDALNQ